MNCQEFGQIVAELAADKLTSVRARVTALTHAAGCQQCVARLEAENTLNQRLIALAESTSGEQAPVRLRQSLRAAFEAQQAKITAEAAATNVIRMPVRNPTFKWQWNWALAAAAAIVFAIAVSLWQSQQAQKNPVVVAGASPTPAVTPVIPMPSPEVTAPQNNVAANVESRKQTGEMVKRKRLPQRRQQSIQAYENDLAANYIPLNYAAGSVTPEESLVVRVDVARTTLIAMGLPLPMNLNAERGNEMVKADLRVGIDGVPLAIRLVRQ